jgi:uncharacterized OB-fold protein
LGIKEMMNLSDDDVRRPMPRPTPWSQPFWDAAREHRLVLKKCKSCGTLQHPPYLYCRQCSSEEAEWIEASGKATLYGYTVNEFAVPFPFWDDLPYVTAIIDLAEGVRMISNVVDCPPAELVNGMALEVVFDDVSPEFTLPKWRPARR